MKTITSWVLMALSTVVLAQPVPDSPPKEHEFKLGLAAVTSESGYIGGKSQNKVFPAIDYQNKRFYVQAGDMGFNLVDEKSWEVDLGLGINLIGDTERGDSRLLQDLPKLSLPLNAFVSAMYKSPIGVFKVKHNHEINNKHNGNSSSISYAAPIFRGKWLVMPQLSYEHYSAEVVNYFFGVNAIDATAEIPAYSTGSARAVSLSVLALYEMNEQWSFVGNLQNEYAGSEISDSPLVDDDQRLSLFAGFLYKIF